MLRVRPVQTPSTNLAIIGTAGHPVAIAINVQSVDFGRVLNVSESADNNTFPFVRRAKKKYKLAPPK